MQSPRNTNSEYENVQLFEESLGFSGSQPLPIGASPEEGVNPFLFSAQQGCVTSQLFLGNYYAWQGKSHFDLDKAVFWLNKASQQGCPAATDFLKTLTVCQATSMVG